MANTLLFLAIVCIAMAFALAMSPIRYTRNGGMRFFRIARLQVSWCVCRTSLSSVREG